MVNIIWIGFILIGSFYMILTGNSASLNEQILKGGIDGIKLLWEMLPLLVLWSGIMQIAEDSGLLAKFSSLVKPLLSKLFPSLKLDHPALGYIASNIAANALGLGRTIICPHPKHFNLKSTPIRVISHNLLPQGCCFFVCTISPILYSINTSLFLAYCFF